jgi:hypothetical protein
MSVINVIALASDDRWSLFSYPAGSLTGFPEKRDFCVRITVKKNGSDSYFGSLLLWRENSKSDYLQITSSLGNLSKAIASAIGNMSSEHQRIAIKNALGNYCHTRDTLMLVEEEKTSFLSRPRGMSLKKETKDLIARLPDITEEWKGSDWKVEFHALTGTCLEKHVFIGRLNPFFIKKHEVELIAHDVAMDITK